ncbi:MAG: alpha/beta fold hydrolase [Neisseriaceae bacterium]
MGIFKEISGIETGENVVIIHGGGASHLDMQPVAKQLSSHYRVLNINLPGTGASSCYSSIQNIHDIADYILNDLPNEATYIGWSFGGLVTQSIAARYPERVKQLIGIGTTPRFIEANDWHGFAATGYSPIVVALLNKGHKANDFLKMFYESEFENVEPKPTTYYEIQKLWESPTISNDMLSKRIAICDTTDLRDLFKTISCPIDFIIGDQDSNVPKEAFAKIKSLNSNVTIHELTGAMHAPFWTHQQQFNQILEKILPK